MNQYQELHSSLKIVSCSESFIPLGNICNIAVWTRTPYYHRLELANLGPNMEKHYAFQTTIGVPSI